MGGFFWGKNMESRNQHIEGLQKQLAAIDARLERLGEWFPNEGKKPYENQHPLFRSQTGGLVFQRLVIVSQLNPDNKERRDF